MNLMNNLLKKLKSMESSDVFASLEAAARRDLESRGENAYWGEVQAMIAKKLPEYGELLARYENAERASQRHAAAQEPPCICGRGGMVRVGKPDIATNRAAIAARTTEIPAGITLTTNS